MFSEFFMSVFGRETLIAADNTWGLLMIMCITVAAAIYLEQRFKWASKISGAILALIVAVLFSNLGIIPTSSTLYDDIIWGYAVPMGIPLLLLQCNLRKIWRETGKMMIIFLIGSVGTFVGALVAYALLHEHIPELSGVAAMMTGSYIGGGVNFSALASEFELSGEIVGATTVADNLLMALYFFVLIAFAGMSFFRKHYKHPHIDEVSKTSLESAQTNAAAYWKRKDISIKDIAIAFAYSVSVVTVARLISGTIAGLIPTSNALLSMLNTFFGSQYVWITTVAVICATFAEKPLSKINGTQEIGTYLIYLFLFVIGVPASIVKIITETPLLLAFTALIVVINMIFCFVGGKIFRFNLEEIILASNANIGGPTTAAGMAISQGWSKLVGPCMMVGTFGYVIGTYLGVIVGALLK